MNRKSFENLARLFLPLLCRGDMSDSFFSPFWTDYFRMVFGLALIVGWSWFLCRLSKELVLLLKQESPPEILVLPSIPDGQRNNQPDRG